MCIFQWYGKGMYFVSLNLLGTILFISSYRRGPVNEAHDSTFGILENYHYWRFHGSGVIAAFQIIGLIFLY